MLLKLGRINQKQSKIIVVAEENEGVKMVESSKE